MPYVLSIQLLGPKAQVQFLNRLPSLWLTTGLDECFPKETQFVALNEYNIQILVRVQSSWKVQLTCGGKFGGGKNGGGAPKNGGGIPGTLKGGGIPTLK